MAIDPGRQPNIWYATDRACYLRFNLAGDAENRAMGSGGGWLGDGPGIRTRRGDAARQRLANKTRDGLRVAW